MEKMFELISARSSISSADVKAVLDSFQFWMGVYLKGGSIVELKGLGHFYPTLKSKTYTDEKGRKKVGVTVDTVAFRCSPELKKMIRETKLSEEKGRKRPKISPEVRRKNILTYVEENLFITTTTAMSVNGCTRHTALADLKTLVKDNKLIKAKSGKGCVYISIPVEL